MHERNPLTAQQLRVDGKIGDNDYVDERRIE
jgi:hypothetical protein